MNKVTTEYIISVLKEGGYLAQYSAYNSKSGGVNLSSGAVCGVSLMDHSGKELYQLDLHSITNVKKVVDLEETLWEYKPCKMSGIEYRIRGV